MKYWSSLRSTITMVDGEPQREVNRIRIDKNYYELVTATKGLLLHPLDFADPYLDLSVDLHTKE